MNKNMSYTINFNNTPENLELFTWLSQQKDSDDFIINILKESMSVSNKKNEKKENMASIDDILKFFN